MNASTARALLDQLRQLDESDRIEAKRASAIGKSVRETVCALANEPGLGGGWLLLGVEKASDAPGDYRVVGIEDPDKLLSDLHSQCANAFNVPVRIQARAEALEEGTVIVVEVSEADPASRPIHFASQRLAHLRDLGLVEQVPRGPATYYVPGERLEPLAEEGRASTSRAYLRSPTAYLHSLRAYLRSPKAYLHSPRACLGSFFCPNCPSRCVRP